MSLTSTARGRRVPGWRGRPTSSRAPWPETEPRGGAGPARAAPRGRRRGRSQPGAGRSGGGGARSPAGRPGARVPGSGRGGHGRALRRVRPARADPVGLPAPRRPRPEIADAVEERRLREQEARARAATRMQLTSHGDGTTRISATVPRLGRGGVQGAAARLHQPPPRPPRDGRGGRSGHRCSAAVRRAPRPGVLHAGGAHPGRRPASPRPHQPADRFPDRSRRPENAPHRSRRQG